MTENILNYNSKMILSVDQMYQVDKEATRKGFSSWNLMENAGKAVAYLAEKILKGSHKSILVLCGSGLNGGDGYIAAKQLLKKDFKVSVFSSLKTSELKGEVKLAFKNWSNTVYLSLDKDDLAQYDLIIDALLGSGINRELDGSLVSIAQWCKDLDKNILSIDIPSGLNGDTGQIYGNIYFKAQNTITFFKPKIGHLLYPCKEICGKLHVADIGIKESFLKNVNINCYKNSPSLWRNKVPKRNWKKHKYNFGHAAIISGEMTGATRLSSVACLKSGSGMVTIVTPEKFSDVFRLSNPSVMVKSYKKFQDADDFLKDKRINALCFGSGSFPNALTIDNVLRILKLKKPTVLDAGALTCFESNPKKLFSAIHKEVILTPHFGEFKKLFPDLINLPKIEAIKKAAQLSGCVIVLKGPDTLISNQVNDIIISSEPDAPWLATAGTGDVLVGLITSMLAQNIDCIHAAAAAVWIHSYTASKIGPGLISSDLVDNLTNTIKFLHK